MKHYYFTTVSKQQTTPLLLHCVTPLVEGNGNFHCYKLYYQHNNQGNTTPDPLWAAAVYLQIAAASCKINSCYIIWLFDLVHKWYIIQAKLSQYCGSKHIQIPCATCLNTNFLCHELNPYTQHLEWSVSSVTTVPITVCLLIAQLVYHTGTACPPPCLCHYHRQNIYCIHRLVIFPSNLKLI